MPTPWKRNTGSRPTTAEDTPTKRARVLSLPDTIPPTPVTDRTYRAFVEQLDLEEVPQKVFVALCAYLCVCLRWGYPLARSEMDTFILSAPTFWAWLPILEQDQMDAAYPQIPSYHEWLLAEVTAATQDGSKTNVLTEEVLRQIWSENPYIFLRTEITMEAKVAMEAPTEAKSLEDQVLEDVEMGGTD